MRVRGVLSILALMLALQAVPAWAQVDLKQAILKEKIFAPDTKIEVTPSGSEVVVSTYKTERASPDDCKIDAILVGRAVFDNDPSFARVTTLFYEARNPDQYDEVSVSVGDVKSYGAGQISQKQLLAALKLVSRSKSGIPVATASVEPKKADAEPSAVGETAAKSSEPKSSTESPEAEDAEKAKPAIASVLPSSSGHASASTHPASITASSAGNADMYIASYPNYGFEFCYPKRWRFEKPEGSNALVRYSAQGRSQQPPIVEVRLYAADRVTPEALFASTPQFLFDETWRLAWMRGLPSEMQSMFAMMKVRSQQWEQSHYSSYEAERRKEAYDKRRWRDVVMTPVKTDTKVMIGPSKKIAGLQHAYWATAPMSPRVFLRCVLYKLGKYTTQINMLTTEADAATVNAELEQLLHSVKPIGK